MELKDNDILSRNAAMMFSEMDGEVVMMSVENSEYYGLNQIGSHIWKCLESPLALNDLFAKLTDEFDIDIEKCKEDTMPFLRTLMEKNLIFINA